VNPDWLQSEVAELSLIQRQGLENECRREAERHSLKLWRHHGRYLVTDDENRPIVGLIPGVTRWIWRKFARSSRRERKPRRSPK
jgi:hypothetical protein